MEIIIEQIRQTIIKEITKETLEECIKEIDREILSIKSRPYPFYQHHADGLVMAKNIINEMKRERYL